MATFTTKSSVNKIITIIKLRLNFFFINLLKTTKPSETKQNINITKMFKNILLKIKHTVLIDKYSDTNSACVKPI